MRSRCRSETTRESVITCGSGRSDKTDPDGRPVWLGSATYDERVGLSHTTAEVTHHIAPDVDTERDHLVECWKQTSRLRESYYVDDYHKVREGKNGGGDPGIRTGDWPWVSLPRAPERIHSARCALSRAQTVGWTSESARLQHFTTRPKGVPDGLEVRPI